MEQFVTEHSELVLALSALLHQLVSVSSRSSQLGSETLLYKNSFQVLG